MSNLIVQQEPIQWSLFLVCKGENSSKITKEDAIYIYIYI